jgi:hypothetical protein
MFSANENLILRQEKRRIVNEIEATMPEEALDFGTTVMVMQVSCKAPGCVPLETAIIIVFPKSSVELVPGLPESCDGGNYKTKILKPMKDVTRDDILDALSPAFKGGRRTMETLCLYARDVMLAQITQLFGEEQDSDSDRRAMAEYLRQCLDDYIANGCRAPEQGVEFQMASTDVSRDSEDVDVVNDVAGEKNESPAKVVFPTTGNIVIKRAVGDASPADNRSSSDTVLSGKVPVKHQRAIHNALNPSTTRSIANLFNREHAPGIRQAGCPCCDPENLSNVVDTMMML